MTPMKKIFLVLFISANILAKGQSLSLTPNLSPPTDLQKYTHSNYTKSAIFNIVFIENSPYFQSKTNTPILFSTNNGDAMMTLSNMGYLALGNNNPTERLDLKNGRIRFTGEKSTGVPSGLVFTDNYVPSVNYRFHMIDNNTLGLKDVLDNNIFLMNVNTGNVGINKTPSAQALSVTGSVRNKQFENSTSTGSIRILAEANGDLVRAEMDKISITPSSYSRFGLKTNNNFTVVSNLGYYTDFAGPDALVSAPVHVLNNVNLENIEVNLVDNSPTRYLRITILGITLDGGTVSVTSLDSKSSPTSPSVIKINNGILHKTNCASYFYIVNLSVHKTSDDTHTSWDGSNLKIGTLALTYSY